MIEYKGEKVTVMACSKCNINCEHCYISYKGNLTPEQLKERVSKLSKKYKVEINGAEILTDLGYLESYPIAGQDFLMTNGLALYKNPELIDLIKKYGIKKVFMSYHFGIQDDISSVGINQLEENIKNLNAKGLKIRLYTTITSTNYKLIHKIIESAKKYDGVYSIRFTNYVSQGNALNMDKSNILDDEQLRDFFEQLKDERENNDINSMKITRCGTFGNGGSNKFMCYAGTENIVLTPDNNIYPCIFIAKPGMEIGTYTDNQLLLFDEPSHDGSDCIVKQICNRNDQKIFKKSFGGK